MLEIYQKAQRKVLEQGLSAAVHADCHGQSIFVHTADGDCFIVNEWNRDIEFIAEHGVKFASHYQAVKYEQ